MSPSAGGGDPRSLHLTTCECLHASRPETVGQCRLRPDPVVLLSQEPGRREPQKRGREGCQETREPQGSRELSGRGPLSSQRPRPAQGPPATRAGEAAALWALQWLLVCVRLGDASHLGSRTPCVWQLQGGSLSTPEAILRQEQSESDSMLAW